MASHYISRQDIWNFFYALFSNNAYAAAGACGNMQWESGLASDNAENSWNNKTGHSDEWLTERINNGTIDLATFLQTSWYVNNWGFGYGLSQWTTSDRRTLLWNRTIGQGLDIDNIQAQLDYIEWEFTIGRWTGVRNVLIQTNNVHDATYIYCDQYEGGSWTSTRETYATSFYNEFANLPTNTYPIHITIDGNGEADASVNEVVRPYATAGDLVTIWAHPFDDDYFLLWTVDSPQSLTLDRPVTDTTNTFTMPAQKVDLTAHFTGTTPEPPPYPPVPPTPVLNPKFKKMPIWMYPCMRT